MRSKSAKRTAREISKMGPTSARTVERILTVRTYGSQELNAAVLAGEVSINHAYELVVNARREARELGISVKTVRREYDKERLAPDNSPHGMIKERMHVGKRLRNSFDITQCPALNPELCE